MVKSRISIVITHERTSKGLGGVWGGSAAQDFSFQGSPPKAMQVTVWGFQVMHPHRVG